MSIDLLRSWEIIRSQRANLGGIQDEEWTVHVSDEFTHESDSRSWMVYELREGASLVALLEALVASQEPVDTYTERAS